MPSRRRGAWSFLAAALFAVGLLGSAGAEAAAASTAEPQLQLRGDLRLPGDVVVGVARLRAGWLVAGTDSLTRLDDSLAPVRTVAAAIPPAWRDRGYTRLGDLDVAGAWVYVPFVRTDGTDGPQAVARFDPRTLQFVDAVEIAQRDISFVAVDGRRQVAYSMDGADGSELARYDVAAGWRALPPLGLGRTIRAVRGADVASGAVWISTADERHGVYQVDRRTGVVRDLGSAGHFDATIAGLDTTPVGGARVHVAATDARGAVLTEFAVVGEESGPTGESRSGWPPVLVMGAVVLVVAAGGASAVLVYRAWVGLRPRPRRT
jgi:hypothetical protein